MAQEIERKFLLPEAPEWLGGRVGVRIEQGYLALDGEVEVRLRRRGDARLLTVKRGAGEVREEIELALGAEEFELLWPLTESRRLVKTRRLVSVGSDLEAEVDVYEGELAGLVVAEVEFSSERESAEFLPPGWLGREVTGKAAYANQRLALDGLPGPAAAANGNRGPAPGPEKPKFFGLRQGERLDDGARRVAAGRAESALDALAAARAGADPAAAVHEARKDLKKLRALLRLLREPLGEDFFAAENRRYRDAGRLLSRSRDAEVKLETLTALRERFGDELPAGPAAAWAEALTRERDEILAAEEGPGADGLGRARELIGAGRDRVRSWPLAGGSWEPLVPGLTRSYRRARRALKRARKSPTPEHVHDWRKRVKDLWYQLRLVRRAEPVALGEAADCAHDLADLLGDHHDLAVLAADLEHRGGLGERERLATLLARRQVELLAEAFALADGLLAAKPKKFAAPLAEYEFAQAG